MQCIVISAGFCWYSLDLPQVIIASPPKNSISGLCRLVKETCLYIWLKLSPNVTRLFQVFPMSSLHLVQVHWCILRFHRKHAVRLAMPFQSSVNCCKGASNLRYPRFSGELGMIFFGLGREIFLGGGCNSKMFGNKLGGEKNMEKTSRLGCYVSNEKNL